MRKLSRKQWLLLAAKFARDRRQQRRDLVKRRGMARRAARRAANRRGRPRTVKLSLPATIKIVDLEPRTQLLAIIERARKALADGHTVRLDFTDIERLYPCGTLILLAHLDIWIDLFPGKVLGNYPSDEVAEQLFQHFRFIERFGLPNRTTVSHDRVKFWHFKSGRKVDAAAYKDLATTVRDNIAHPERELFADCLNEAVSNAVGHAYDFDTLWTPVESHRKWWVVSSLRDDHIFVAIYDMGVTIPESLRRKPELSDYFRLRKYKDGRLIAAATSSTRTSTRLPHRGKGLPEMLEFSQALASGYLSIASGRGTYSYDAKTGKDSQKYLECTIPGTLVLWQIPFENHSDERKDDLDS